MAFIKNHNITFSTPNGLTENDFNFSTFCIYHRLEPQLLAHCIKQDTKWDHCVH